MLDVKQVGFFFCPNCWRCAQTTRSRPCASGCLAIVSSMRIMAPTVKKDATALHVWQ